MITTEITNKQLNFKKILYQSQREKELQLQRQQQLQNAFNNASLTQQHAPVRDFVEINDDDEDREDRLVIDLNDDNEVKSTIAKSLPIIDVDSKTDAVGFSAGPIKRANIGFSLRHENTQNDIPKFIYLTSDSENSNGSVKIDILTPFNREKQSNLSPVLVQQQRRSLPQRRITMDDRHVLNLRKNEKTTNELDTINTEIDNLVNYKSDRIIDLLKDLVNGRIGSAEFSKKMKSDCDISWKDLNVLTNNLTKNHHFQINKDRVNSTKFLNFPTTASDLVGYFESVRQHLNKQQFLDTMKFYQLIVKELLNLNKAKIIQYLLEFLIIRRNTNNKNVLNLSCPKNQRKPTVSSTTPYTKPLVKIQDKKAENLNDAIFRQCDSNLFYINRTNLIYTSPKSKNNSHTKYVCEIKPSCEEQKRQPKMAPLVPQVSQVVNSNSGSSIPIPHTVTGGLRISTKLMPSPVKSNHHVNKTVETNERERDISSNVSNHRDRIASSSYPLLSAPYSYRYKPTTILTQPQQSQQQQPPLPSTQSHTHMPTHAPIYHHNSHNAPIAQQPSDQSPVSLQRKLHLKYKQKSPKYTEPIQNHHPYYYPAPPPSYFYHPYYYTNYPPSHHMPEPITADNGNHNQPVYEANINQNPYYYPGIPIPYPHSYQTSPEHIESPPSTNSDITQSELYHHLTVPLARPIAQHAPVQSMYHHQPPRNTNASVAYESHLINRTQVNNQASDYYKIYYSKNC